MQTHKEKAEELINFFVDYVGVKLALIFSVKCVDEIIKANPTIGISSFNGEITEYDQESSIYYWELVKEELKKL